MYASMVASSTPTNRLELPVSDDSSSSRTVFNRPASCPVLVRILSGDRAGEFVGIDADRFTVGSATSCEVSFPEYRAAGLNRRAAKIRREAEGWVVRVTGGAMMFVNTDAVDTKATLRSGDLLRLSAQGPEIQFLVQHQDQRSLHDIAQQHTPELVDALAPLASSPEQTESPVVAASSGMLPSGAPKRSSQRWLPLAVAAVALAAALGVAIVSLSTSNSQPAPPAAAE